MAFSVSDKSSRASVIAAAVVLVLINVRLVRGTQTGANYTSRLSPTSSAGSTPIAGLSSSFWPYQTYKSSPFKPPHLEITRNGQSLAPGVVFISPENITPLEAAKDIAPLIMTDDGQLVWNGPNVNATNFRATTYQGAPVLTFWSGISTAGANIGHGYGNITFLDTSYNTILTVCPKLGLVTSDDVEYQCEADIHESFITDRGTLLVTAYNVTQADLSSLGGSTDGWIFDCLFFEIDPTNGDILFRWSAIEHVPVSESKFPLEGTGRNQSVAFDYFHINSVVNIGNNSYLVNSRHVWTTYLVSTMGDIIWTLQGDTGGDFGSLPEEGKFSWQHHARPSLITSDSFTLTYFNNRAAYPVVNGTYPSNGLKLSLPLPPSKSAPPIALSYLSDPSQPISAGSQGSSSTLVNGNIFLDYGQVPVMKEYGPNDPSGRDVRWTARFGADSLVQSYRGFKSEWHGRPSTSPNLVVAASGNGSSACIKGYVSWNGATDVEGWRVSEGSTAGQLSFVGNVGYGGFETVFGVAKRCVQVAVVVGGMQGAKSNVACTSAE